MSGYRPGATAAAFAAALLAAGTATAETPKVLEGLTCTAGVIAHDDVIASLLKAAAVSVDGDVLRAFASNRLGEAVVEWRNAADTDVAFPARALTDETRALIALGRTGTEPSVVVSPDAPRDLDERLLNREAGPWLRFPCAGADSPAAAGEEPAAVASWRDLLIVTSTDDAGKTTDPAERPFATFSYLDDRENDEEVASTDIYIGFSRPIWFGGRASPSLAYQRRTGPDPLNDLTFGLEGSMNRLSWSAGFETDDSFDSALYRAQVEFQPFRGRNICAAAWVRSGDDGYPIRGGRCDLWLTADYVDVADTGGKADLVDRREFGRIGLRAAASWWTRAGESDAYWLLSGSYALYETVSGDDADADFAKFSIDYLPSGESPYSFGVSYERGEDLTSFTAIDQIKFTIGVRR